MIKLYEFQATASNQISERVVAYISKPAASSCHNQRRRAQQPESQKKTKARIFSGGRTSENEDRARTVSAPFGQSRQACRIR